MSDEAIKEIEGLLEAELVAERAVTARSKKVGGVAVGIVAVYLTWISYAIGTLLDPVGLAEAASGFAIGAVPGASAQVREMVVTGAPELVRLGSDKIVEMIPNYRIELQSEIDPVIDDVSGLLAEAAVAEMLKSGGDAKAVYSDDAALIAAADAAGTRMDAILGNAMDKPDEEGLTPRSRIDASLSQLKSVDKELKLLARNGGDPQQREILLAFLNVMQQ